MCESVWYVYQCVRAWVCVCLREAQWVGESGSAGTHSCFMVLFQEELLDLLVFTGSQFVCLRVCVSLPQCVKLGVGPHLWGRSCSPPQLPSHSFRSSSEIRNKMNWWRFATTHTKKNSHRLWCDSALKETGQLCPAEQQSRNMQITCLKVEESETTTQWSGVCILYR